MNRTLYSILLWLYLPFVIIKLYKLEKNTPSWKTNLAQRFGKIKAIEKNLVWIHCSSIGEINTASALISELIKNHKLLITTATQTGANAVKQNFGNKVFHCYFPFDCKSFVKRFLKNTTPKVCILMETEIWPNLIYELAKAKTSIILINARLSEKSLRFYLRYTPKLIRKTLSHYTLIAAQDKISYDRFLSINASKKSLYIASNIKYTTGQKPAQKTLDEIKHVINNRTAVVFASTHPQEETEIIKSLQKHQNNLDALIIIVPRKPERFDEVYTKIKKAGFVVSRRSYNKPCLKEVQVLLGDSMGELSAYFRESSIVFIGGSLDMSGGHNMLEAAEHSKPIIYGPNIANFAEVSRSLLEDDAAIQVQDANELFAQITHLLNDKKRCSQLGKKAKKNLKKHAGAVDKLVKLLAPHLQ